MSRILLVSTTALILIGACSSEPNVENRVTDWDQRLKNADLIGANATEVIAWLDAQGVENVVFPLETAVLERMDGDGFVCSSWHVVAEFDFGSNQHLEAHTVSSAGTCL